MAWWYSILQTCLELFSCSLMLDDLGETVQGAGRASCSLSCHVFWQVAALGTIPTTLNLQLGQDGSTGGMPKNRLTFSKLIRGGDRKSTWG